MIPGPPHGPTSSPGAQALPRAGNGVSEARFLNVDEQRAAIGREAGTAEFRSLCVGVAGEVVELLGEVVLAVGGGVAGWVVSSGAVVVGLGGWVDGSSDAGASVEDVSEGVWVTVLLGSVGGGGVEGAASLLVDGVGVVTVSVGHGPSVS